MEKQAVKEKMLKDLNWELNYHKEKVEELKLKLELLK